MNEIIKREYSAKQSWYEFKQVIKRAMTTIPLFSLMLWMGKVILYFVSWLHFYSQVEPLLINDPAFSIVER